jgi:PPOX class probable F420-dependent enzyme
MSTKQQPQVVLGEQDLALFRGRNFGHVSTLRADGSPHSVALWIDETDGVAWFNSADTSAHVKHLRRDPRIAMSVHDQENPYLAVTLLGTAVLTQDGADEDVDLLTRKYTDMEEFPDEWRVPGSRRVTVEIVPTRVLRYGY